MTRESLESVRQRELARVRAEYARRQQDVPADRYSLANPAHRFLHDSQNHALDQVLEVAGLAPLAGKRLLEVGCGSGRWLAHFAQLGIRPNDLTGIDLDLGRLRQARASTPDAAAITADASRLPWTDGCFDLVLQSTVMTSILDPALRTAIAAEMMRVVRADGAILWYDFRVDNPRNRQVRGVRRRELHGLFPRCEIMVRRTTLAPPLARLLVPRLRAVAGLLDRLTLFATHDIAVIRPHDGHPSI